MTANVQIIERDGVPEYAVMPYEEYEALVRLSERMHDIRAYDAAMADAGETVPHEVVRRLVNGDSPLRVWREYRKLTGSGEFLNGWHRLFFDPLSRRERECSL